MTSHIEPTPAPAPALAIAPTAPEIVPAFATAPNASGTSAVPGVQPRDFYPLGIGDKWFEWQQAPTWLAGAALMHEKNRTLIKLQTGTQFEDNERGLRFTTKPALATTSDFSALVRLGAQRYGSSGFTVYGAPDFVMKSWAAAEHAGVRFVLTDDQKELYKKYKTEHREKLIGQYVAALGPAAARQQQQEKPAAQPKPQVDAETSALLEKVRAAQALLAQQQKLLAEKQALASSVRDWRQTQPLPAHDPQPQPARPAVRGPR